MKRALMLALGILALAPGAAEAADWTTVGKVTMVEATSMPNGLIFSIDANAGTNGNCSAGNGLGWIAKGPDGNTQQQNSQAAFALLLTAKSTGQSIRISGYNNCSVELLYLVQ